MHLIIRKIRTIYLLYKHISLSPHISCGLSLSLSFSQLMNESRPTPGCVVCIYVYILLRGGVSLWVGRLLRLGQIVWCAELSRKSRARAREREREYGMPVKGRAPPPPRFARYVRHVEMTLWNAAIYADIESESIICKRRGNGSRRVAMSVQFLRSFFFCSNKKTRKIKSAYIQRRNIYNTVADKVIPLASVI